MAASEGLVIGIETQLDAKGEVKLLKEINSPGIKIYFKFQNALENGRDLCKELKILGKKRICQIHCTDTDGVTPVSYTHLDVYKRQIFRFGLSSSSRARLRMTDWKNESMVSTRKRL